MHTYYYSKLWKGPSVQKLVQRLRVIPLHFSLEGPLRGVVLKGPPGCVDEEVPRGDWCA